MTYRLFGLHFFIDNGINPNPDRANFRAALLGAKAYAESGSSKREMDARFGQSSESEKNSSYANLTQSMPASASLTERLNLFMQGEKAVTDALLEEVLPKLHEIAERELKREHRLAPLSKTELIHEIWLGNLAKGGWQIENRGHFFALASLAMRRILVNQARKRLAQRRGGGETPVELEKSDVLLPAAPEDDTVEKIVEIGILMDRLEAKHPDSARIVDMHYFSGFTLEEIAHETGLTFESRSAYAWEKGLKWLKRSLSTLPR